MVVMCLDRLEQEREGSWAFKQYRDVQSSVSGV